MKQSAENDRPAMRPSTLLKCAASSTARNVHSATLHARGERRARIHHCERGSRTTYIAVRTGQPTIDAESIRTWAPATQTNANPVTSRLSNPLMMRQTMVAMPWKRLPALPNTRPYLIVWQVRRKG